MKYGWTIDQDERGKFVKYADGRKELHGDNDAIIGFLFREYFDCREVLDQIESALIEYAKSSNQS